MHVVGQVDPAVVSELEAITRSHRTLEDVTRWALFSRPARQLARVVVQDEYTHDVVIACEERVYLVYDTT